jgi:hypothetical protein
MSLSARSVARLRSSPAQQHVAEQNAWLSETGSKGVPQCTQRRAGKTAFVAARSSTLDDGTEWLGRR